MKDYDIKHTTPSPYHPQANGQAERTVQTVKRLLVKAKDPYKALLDYRNSPLDTGFSPAQLFLGRRLKTTLPTTSKLYNQDRTWKFQGASQRNNLLPAEAEILLRQEGERKPVDISSRRSSHDEVRGHLEDS